jgi:hypothetical protein
MNKPTKTSLSKADRRSLLDLPWISVRNVRYVALDDVLATFGDEPLTEDYKPSEDKPGGVTEARA